MSKREISCLKAELFNYYAEISSFKRVLAEFDLV